MKVINDGIKEEAVSSASKQDPEKSGTASRNLTWDLELVVKDDLSSKAGMYVHRYKKKA